MYTDCGAHTITAWPDLDDNRLLAYVSSYPLRPGPTCGQVNGPRVGRDPLHGVIQALEVPLGNPAAAHEIAEPPISYPGAPGSSARPAGDTPTPAGTRREQAEVTTASILPSLVSR